MKFPANMRVASKIMMALGLFVLLCAGLTIWSVSQARLMASGTQALVARDARGLYLASSAQESATRLDQLSYAIVLAPTGEAAHTLQSRLEEESGGQKEAVMALKPLLSATELGRYGEAAEQLRAFQDAEQRLYALKVNGDMAGATAVLQGPVADSLGRADKAFDDLVDGQRGTLESGATAANRLAVNVAWTMVLGAVLGTAGISALAYLVVRSQITRPLAVVCRAMSRLAAGELETQVPAGGPDEIGQMAGALAVFKDSLVERGTLQAQAAAVHRENEEKLRQTEADFRAAGLDQEKVVEALARALGRLAKADLTCRLDIPVAAAYQSLKDDFNRAIDAMELAIEEVAGGAKAMTSGIGEIGQASDDLSRRTEQQAASLEETAAALDEITATVKRSAEGAKQASSTAVVAKGETEKSGVVMRDAILAMSEIEQSSRQITQIIGVIDEIAFQTNLLALNAGVEAARAGDAGRGFAVVAQEVRALAQRSAQAAKEIKALIASSSAQVERGVRLVNDTGQALTAIAGNVAAIDALVAEISQSSQEQAMGLNQVNGALNQMDQITQQNAAMVEQATAATHTLAQHAKELSASVGQFQFGENRQSLTLMPKPTARAAA